jgi:transposase
LFAKEQLRADVQKERADWVYKMKDIDPKRLVFLDETSVNCGMTRLYGRSHKNERIYDYVPDVRFKRTSIISTVRLSGDSVPFMFKGTLDGDLFIGYIEQYLVPTLKKDDILVLDSCSAHKKYELDAVYERGASVWFLPRYSPDLSPSENSWAKVKSTLRRLKARNEQDLEKAMGEALNFSTNDLQEGLNIVLITSIFNGNAIKCAFAVTPASICND